MQPWFTEAKFGIFVHYGIYSVEGVPESWALFDHVMPHEQYMRQLDGFTASGFDAAGWARLFARAGAGYAVLTARHHDGVALWMSELARTIRDLAPDAVCNSRLLGHGDYATPEQGLPVSAPQTPWELCLTVNDSWGYRPHDVNHQTVGQLVRYFAQTIGMGGNLLLGVGPRADGTIVAEQAERLEGLGEWIRRHSPAVHGSVAGLPPGHHYGPSTLSADRRTLYLVCFDPPSETVCVRGLRNAVRRISVLALELNGELELYTGRGRD